MAIPEPVSSALLSVGASLIAPVFEAAKSKIQDPIQQVLVKAKLDALAASAFIKMESYLRNEISGKDAEQKIQRLVEHVGSLTLELSSSTKAIVSATFNAERVVADHIACPTSALMGPSRVIC